MKPEGTAGRSPPPEEDEAFLEAAVRAAEEAAELHREEAGRLDPAEWGEKGTADFVTEVDREAERRIIRVLRSRFPDHEILAEEGTQGEVSAAQRQASVARRGTLDEARAPDARLPGAPAVQSPDVARGGPPVSWIIDPLDGTTNWLHGYPEYAVSIAALDERGPRVGVVLNSASGERFEAVRGRGSRRDGEPIRVSAVSRFGLALVGTGFPFRRLELLPAYLGMLERVLRAASGVRRAGSAALDLCDLACGRLDAFWELWLMPWDVAAGILIVREAGGVFGPLELEPGGVREGLVEGGAPGGGPPGGEADPTGGGAIALRGAMEAARDFIDRGGGARPPGTLRAGAYMGANAHLLEKLRRVLSG